MLSLEFMLFCVVVLSMAGVGFASRNGVFRFPVLVAFLGIAWIIPQGIETELSPGNEYLTRGFWIYATACCVAIYLGFAFGNRKKVTASLGRHANLISKFSINRLLHGAAALCVLGHTATWMIRGMDTSSLGTQWSGVVTFYYLLSTASTMSLCLSVLLFLRTKSRFALVIAVVAALPLVGASLEGVRRQQLFELVILTFGASYFLKNKSPPRVLIIASFLAGMVLINKVGEARALVIEEDVSFFEVATSVDFYTSFDFFDLEQGASSEILLAQYDYQHVNETGELAYGADYWNQLVHQYVPAFIVGYEVKDSLKWNTLNERLKSGEQEGAYSLGSTRTGFSDTYRNFHIYGVFIFLLIGYGFGSLYQRSSLGGIDGQYFYLLLLAQGIKSITHSTTTLLAALPFIMALSLLVFGYARLKTDRKLPNLRHYRVTTS